MLCETLFCKAGEIISTVTTGGLDIFLTLGMLGTWVILLVVIVKGIMALYPSKKR